MNRHRPRGTRDDFARFVVDDDDRRLPDAERAQRRNPRRHLLLRDRLYAPVEWGSLWQGYLRIVGASLDANGQANLWTSAPTPGGEYAPTAKLDPLPVVDRVGHIGAQLDGELSDVIVFTGAVSSATRDAMWLYLGARASAVVNPAIPPPMTTIRAMFTAPVSLAAGR